MNAMTNLNRLFVEVMWMILLRSSEVGQSFQEHMSSKHQTNFSVEHNELGSLLFLDVRIYLENYKFVTSV